MRPTATSPRDALRLAALLAVLAVLLGLPSTTGSPALAATRGGQVPVFGSGIEAFATYQGQTLCSPAAKPGAVALQAWLLARYPGTGSSGTSRGCSVGGRSEHKEGRAFDWRVDVTNEHQRAQAQAFLALVLATDAQGNRAALARRMGLMYLIWDDQIYSAGQGFRPRPYVNAGCSAEALAACGSTLRHRDHVHISMSWAGALARTSFWDGTVSGLVAPPGGTPIVPPAVPRPTPSPTPSPAPRPLPTRPAPVPLPTTPPVASPRPQPAPKPVVRPKPKPVVKPAPKPAVRPAPKPAGTPAPAPPAPPAPPVVSVPSGPAVLDQRRTPVALLSVPVTGPGITTAFSLAAGRTYRLLASGGYAEGPGARVADAACAWQLTADDGWAGSARQLQVSGAAAWRSRDGGRCDADEHVYVWDYTPPLTAPLHLGVGGAGLDGSAAEATGVLQLRVLAAGADVRGYTTALPELVPEPVAPPTTSGEPLSGTEVVTVDAADGGRTQAALQAGRAYTVEVAGTWSAGEGITADAQCSRTPSGTWRPQRSADPWHPSVDSYNLYAGGVPLQAEADCDAGHVYRYRYVPQRSGRVAFAVWDPTPGDDTGSMQVTVWPRQG